MRGVRESKGGGGGGGGGGPPADLLVCFPSRARLALMPKPTCSPVRPNSEPNKRHPHSKRGRAGGGGPVSPLLWAKGKHVAGGGPDLAEPTSPKVTCAGQIKVGPRPPGSSAATCSNWQSVMQEIERLHNSRSSKHHANNDRKISKSKKKSRHWGEALGFKKDIINFLTCLGNIRFDFRCFGSFPHHPDITSDEEDDGDEKQNEDEDEEEDHDHDQQDEENNTVFSKWFMVLQQNQDKMNIDHQTDANCTVAKQAAEADDQVQVPPPNALLLMRCRSAPAKRSNWPRVLQGAGSHAIDGAESEDEHHVYEEDDQEQKEQQPPAVSAEEKLRKKKKKRESLAVVMKYDVDFDNMASEVSKETWLVGDLQDAFVRSRSWKR